MTMFTLSELKKILEQCQEDASTLEESTLDSTFKDLGYDSLTVYELVTRIQDDYAVSLPDETLDELTTPAALIAYVNGQLAAA